MNKIAKITIAIVGVIIVAVGVLLLTNSKSDTKPATSSGNTAASATITYTNSGFSPAEITVSSGSSVAIVNNSDGELQFDSDPHPVHSDDPDLNVGSVAPGGSTKFTVTQKGTFGYHNHLDASQQGKIIVK